MWTLLNDVGDLVAGHTDWSEAFKVLLALVFANKITALAKEMVPREEQAAANESQVQVAGDGSAHTWDLLVACR